ncbi:MAG: DNA translocase FtsK, partial [Microcystis panniformis]
LPYQIRYTFCDPVNNGGAFLMRRSLPEALIRENSGEVYRDLLEVTQDIRRVKETYLDPQSPALHLLPPDIRVNERFEGIFVADFPKRYDRRDIEELQKIGNSGPEAGRYVFIHYNQDIDLPRDINMSGFENAFYIDLNKQSKTATSCQLQFKADSIPDADL